MPYRIKPVQKENTTQWECRKGDIYNIIYNFKAMTAGEIAVENFKKYTAQVEDISPHFVTLRIYSKNISFCISFSWDDFTRMLNACPENDFYSNYGEKTANFRF